MLRAKKKKKVVRNHRHVIGCHSEDNGREKRKQGHMYERPPWYICLHENAGVVAGATGSPWESAAGTSAAPDAARANSSSLKRKYGFFLKARNKETSMSKDALGNTR